MADRRLYELINPSDAITFWATPLEAWFIHDRMGSGPYFVKDVETREQPAEPADAYELYELLWHDAEQIKSYSEAYASFLVASPRDRKLYDELVAGMTDEQRKARRDAWHEERCTSMNDICAQCWAVAVRTAAYPPETSDLQKEAM